MVNFLYDLLFPSARETVALSLPSRHSRMPLRSFSRLARMRVTSTRAGLGVDFFFFLFQRPKLGCAPFLRLLVAQSGPRTSPVQRNYVKSSLSTHQRSALLRQLSSSLFLFLFLFLLMRRGELQPRKLHFAVNHHPWCVGENNAYLSLGIGGRRKNSIRRRFRR